MPAGRRPSPLNGSASKCKSSRSVEVAAMFNKKTMVLYCGGAPTMAPNAPASPGGGVVGGGGGGGNSGSVTPGASSPLVSLMGGGPSWGANGFCEGPRALIGGGPRAGPLARIGPWEAPPRALIGPAAAAEQPLWRPGTLALPEGELDGCEPDSEDGEAEATVVPSPTASLESVSSEAEKEMAAEAEGGDAGAGASPDLLQDGLRRMTLEVVGRYLREAADGGAKGGGGAKFALQGFLGRFGGSPAEAEVAQALETLRRVGESLLEKHQLAFQGMLRKMEIKKEDDLKTISEVAKEVFRDGIVNWGRIVTLISFGAFVAKHLKSINQENGINTLIEIITDVLVTDKREWLVKHNAWEGFVQFFHVEDIEGGIRNVLMAFASVAGIGASLAYMIR